MPLKPRWTSSRRHPLRSAKIGGMPFKDDDRRREYQRERGRRLRDKAARNRRDRERRADARKAERESLPAIRFDPIFGRTSKPCTTYSSPKTRPGC